MWDELRRPATLIAVTLFLLSVIIGILTSLYFYIKSEKVGQVAFSVEQIQIFDNTRAGVLPLTVLDASGARINSNIFAANVIIWNSGNAEIRKEDVREPLRIAIPEARLLDLVP